MAHLTIDIPEQQLNFFKELVSKLGFKIAEQDVPEWQKEIVRKRIEESNPDELINWDTAKNQFNIPK